MIGCRLWQIAGWTMLHYLWIGATLGAMALVVRPRLRLASANVRYLFALASLFLLSIALVVIAVVMIQDIAPVAHGAPSPINSASQPEAMRLGEMLPTTTATMPASAMATNLPVQTAETRSSEQLLAVLNLAVTCLPWLWICGAPLSFLLTTAGLLGAERLRRQSRPLEDARITEMCRQLTASLKISYRVGVAVCDRIAVPILVGVLRPMILLPAVALAGWSLQQLEMVLLHELAHVRRYDNLVNLLQRIIESLLFFHPMVWIISGWVRREREHCCDELVVARTRQPHAYAEMLVTLSESFSRSPLRNSSLVHPQAVSSMAQRPLVARIRRILKKEEQSMQVSRKAVGLGLATLVAIAAMVGGYYCLPSCASDSSAEVEELAGETTRNARSAVPGDVIEGAVVNEQGEPQPGIDVWTAGWHERKVTARSGSDGRFRLEIPELLIGEFSLFASNARKTRQGILTTKKLGPSKLPLQKLVLKASRIVEVQVVDASSKPVGAATVEICIMGGTAWHAVLEPAVADARGRARLLFPADAKIEWIAAFKAGVGMDYVYVKGDRAKGQSAAETVKLVLNGVMPISVRLHDSRGRAVAGVEVAPWQLSNKRKPAGLCFRNAPVGAISDAQGRVQFDWLPADLEKRVEFAVRSGDYYYPAVPQLSIKDGGSRNLDVELAAPAQIGGRVTYPDGKPAAGIMIEAEGMGTWGQRFHARTAEDGTYRLKVHPNNSYIIAVVNDRWAAVSLMGIVLKEGEKREKLDLHLNTGTLIHGAIIAETDKRPWLMVPPNEPMLFQYGPEIPNVWKSSPFSTPWGGGLNKYRVRLLRMGDVDAAGNYAFRVGPGEYELSLPGFPSPPTTKWLTVTNQREIVVDYHVPKLPPPLRGIVVDRAGKPVPRAVVRYLGTRYCKASLVADKDGRFTVPHGQTQGYVYAGSVDANLAGFRAVSENENDVTVVVDKAAAVVGRVVDAGGRPLSGISVQARFFAPQPYSWPIPFGSEPGTMLLTPQGICQRFSVPLYFEPDNEGRYKMSALMPGWQGEISFIRFSDGKGEVISGPKIVVEPGENRLPDTIVKPAAPKVNDPSGKTSAEKPADKKKPAEPLTYTGQVTDKLTGKPIAGATVTVRRRIVAPYEYRVIEQPKYTTDAAGKYTFTIPPNQVADPMMYIELDVSHPDYATRKGFGYSLTMIRKNEQLGVRPFFEHVELYPADSITATVVTPEGKPIAGMKVLGFSMPDRRDFESASFSDSITDRHGAFRLTLTKGTKAIFWLLPKDYAPSTHLVDENRGNVGRFMLEKGTVLTGRVVDEQKKPVAGVWINAEITGGPAKHKTDLPVADCLVRSGLTDAKGEFTLAPLPAGQCMVRVEEYPREKVPDDQIRRPPPEVFGPKKLILKAAEATSPIEIRAIPQVVIEGQFYDSQGKPRLGHKPMLLGRMPINAGPSWMTAINKVLSAADNLDRGGDRDFYFMDGTMDKSGHFVIRAPKGLEDAKLDLMTNEHGALRVRMAKGSPLSNQCREISLGTLDRDIRGIEVVRYNAPILLVKPVTEHGGLLREAKVRIEYANGRGPWKSQGRFIEGKGVHFEKQDDGRWRSSQLLPDEEFTITVEADGYESKSEKLKLPEGAIKELDLRLKKRS